jgi:type II secretory pathway component GspD/PulD (secretin)
VKAILSEISSVTGVSILADSSVKSNEISIEFKDDSVEAALEKLSYVAGLLWKKKGDMYLVSTPSPDAPLFNEFAKTKIYVPRTQPAESLYGLLARSYVTFAQLDKSANLISITAPEKMLASIWAALEVADGRRRQFIVEALVTEIKEEQGKEIGFSWNWKHFGQAADLGVSYATATADDIINIKALISKNKAMLRANPSILAAEGREASITIGSETYFSIVTGTTTNTNIQLQRINTGITLKLTGFVEDSGALNLHLQPEVSDAAAPVGGNPATTVRRADTYLRVEPGQTIVLGGLIRDIESSVNNKIPLLGDLPLVGGLFRNSRKVKQRTEVVIMITPRLVEPLTIKQ